MNVYRDIIRSRRKTKTTEEHCSCESVKTIDIAKDGNEIYFHILCKKPI